MRPVRRLKKTCSPPDALAKVLPEAVLRGIAALRLRLDSADEGLLREVPVRAGELASFEFPLRRISWARIERCTSVSGSFFRDTAWT